VLFATSIAVLAVGLGLLVNVLLGDAQGISLHEAVHEEPDLLATICLFALAAMAALSVLRQGPRGFLYQVLSPYSGEDDHAHEGDHDHDHNHEQ
jgi:hypothetical protein